MSWRRNRLCLPKAIWSRGAGEQNDERRTLSKRGLHWAAAKVISNRLAYVFHLESYLMFVCLRRHFHRNDWMWEFFFRRIWAKRQKNPIFKKVVFVLEDIILLNMDLQKVLSWDTFFLSFETKISQGCKLISMLPRAIGLSNNDQYTNSVYPISFVSCSDLLDSLWQSKKQWYTVTQNY